MNGYWKLVVTLVHLLEGILSQRLEFQECLANVNLFEMGQTKVLNHVSLIKPLSTIALSSML